ncbi:MAG: hypothetical protein QXO75_10505 [Nitrososphaerota archaeon]
MRVYPTRNPLTSESSFKSVLKYCEGKPEFIVDGASLLEEAPNNAWISPSTSDLRIKKPSKLSLLIIQTTHKNLLQQNNSQPKTQHSFKMEKGCGMLEPALQNIHILLQPPKG